ncbi:MAG: PHP domain-containing protein [Deltaproteobacteria bacterium]|nr:PHP domain-containing protein [Deltaproteobacteria bacterium]
MEPATIASQLRELAIYYELDGDRHRSFAYDRASRAIEAANGLHRMIDEGRLEELPGVGPSIAKVVAELARRGTVAVLERLRAQWPNILLDLAMLPSGRGTLGAGKARTLWTALAPPDLDAVAALCRDGKIRELKGFGKGGEAKLLAAIEERRARGARVILIDAQDHARSLAAHLAADPACARVEICGPVRRWCEAVEVLAYAVQSEDPDAIARRFAAFGPLTSAGAQAPAAPDEPLVGHLAGGLRVDVYVAPARRVGWAQVIATGSPEHVALLRARAHARGIDPATPEATPEAPDEERVYASLGLPWLPPEVRDGTDELAAADAGDAFTDLIAPGDLTAAFHCHTTYSDGRDTIADMVAKAAELGFAAITITDHSAAASYASGLALEQLRAQAAEIAALADPPARILHGTEADILADGNLDVPPEMIGALDVIIASVHQRFKLDEDAMTQRLVTAMRQPYFKVWGHALGRLVLRRDPIAVRLDDILDAVAGSRAAIEINGDPYRLDLDPVNARRAVARGIKFVLSSDAHSANALTCARYAIAMARRARIRKRDVLNALPVDELADAIRPRPD